jgi:hypothetical protein
MKIKVTLKFEFYCGWVMVKTGVLSDNFPNRNSIAVKGNITQTGGALNLCFATFLEHYST